MQGMKMTVRPRVALLAFTVLGVLFLAGVSWQTLLLTAGGAYMLSMHLGGHGGGRGGKPSGGSGDQVTLLRSRTPGR
jgi:hypothetical protein